MKKTVCLTLLLAAIPAAAQTFGQPFPVTNTRYDTAYGKPRLSANGRDFFLFWAAERKIRATSLAQATPRVGHVVLDTSGEFDVTWTGEVFVAAATRSNNRIVGRVLDAGAQPLGGELALAADGRDPRLAAGPEAMLMVHRGTAFDTRLLVLGPRGESIGAESSQLGPGGRYAVAGNENGFAIALSNWQEFRLIRLNRRGQIVSEHSFVRPTGPNLDVALATDGDRFLMAWIAGDEVASVLLHGNGSLGTPFVIRRVSQSSSLTSAWIGGGWSISYQTAVGAPSRAHVAHLDRAARAVIAEEQSTAGVHNPTFAAVGGRMMAAWNPVAAQLDVSSVVELPLAANEPRVATYAATQQTLLATASSADATLMVWSEISESGESIRTGVRTHEGRWTEAELNVSGWEAVAASDGDQFAVIVMGSNGTKLFRLDGRGRPLGSPRTLPAAFRTAMAWNGTHYGIVSDMQAMLLTPTGALSAPVAIPHDDFELSGRVSLASNGDGFLLVGEEVNCQFLLCISSGFSAVRLDDRLQRISTNEIRLSDMGGDLAGVVWNGSEYVTAWDEGDGVHTARTAAAAGSPVTKTFTAANLHVAGIAPMPDGTIAIAGTAGPSNLPRVAFLRSNGSIAQLVDVDSSAAASRTLLAPLPGGVAYVASSVQDAAPHHGTSHVMMAISRPSVPRPPDPPYVAAQLKDGAILVDWSASAGALNGFRLEYRVDDGSWNELEEWFPPSVHHRMIRPSSGTHYAIRMRAFNDGGASAYSETALTKPMRRRAAGH